MALLAARAIAELLADRMPVLAPLLLPNGCYGAGRRTWRCGTLDGDAGSALCAWLDGPRRGRWRDYRAGQGGDALDLVAAVACNGDLAAAIGWARDWLGLGAVDGERAEQMRRQAEAARERRGHQAEVDAVRQARDAKALWLAGVELQQDDAAWRYLLGRGIDLAELPQAPAALRLQKALWNPESRRCWPALLAAISGAAGQFVNAHRIWLRERPDGSVMKAPIARPKLSMPGGYAGGCVRLWRGASGKPWSAMPQGETLLVGEGIEDTLAIVCARPEWRAASVLSVSSIAALALPPQVRRLVWIAQNDPPGSPAAQTLARGLRVHRLAGRAVAVIRPPRWVKDVAELAQLAAEEDAA
jgi:hypothetical protein